MKKTQGLKRIKSKASTKTLLDSLCFILGGNDQLYIRQKLAERETCIYQQPMNVSHPLPFWLLMSKLGTSAWYLEFTIYARAIYKCNTVACYIQHHLYRLAFIVIDLILTEPAVFTLTLESRGGTPSKRQ